MFVHGETNPGTTPANDNEVTVFVRLGTDFVSNYYEYEMPLKISPWYNNNDYSVWPEENNMVINLQALKDLKEERNFTTLVNLRNSLKKILIIHHQILL